MFGSRQSPRCLVYSAELCTCVTIVHNQHEPIVAARQPGGRNFLRTPWNYIVVEMSIDLSYVLPVGINDLDGDLVFVQCLFVGYIPPGQYLNRFCVGIMKCCVVDKFYANVVVHRSRLVIAAHDGVRVFANRKFRLLN